MGSIGHDKPTGHADDACDFRLDNRKFDRCLHNVVINDDGYDVAIRGTNDSNVC